jgi:AsmA protein
MKKLFKIILSLFTLGFTVILVGVIYVINIDPNNHKDWITEQIDDRSGLQVTFNGDIGLSLYPWLGITLDQVVIASPSGFSDTPLFQAETMQIRARLMPMLDREYEIDTILVHGAQVHLETNAAGQGNWQISAAENMETAESQDQEALFNRLIVGGVDIQNAALTFDDRFNSVLYAMDEFTASTGELVYGEPLDVFLGFNARATQPALSARVNLTGTALYDLDNQVYEVEPFNMTGTLSGDSVPNGSADIALTTNISLNLAEDLLTLRDFSLSALDAQVNANINGTGVTGNDPVYQVNMAAAGTDLAVFFQILENDALVAQIRALNSRAFRVNALIESSSESGSLTITGLDAELLDASISGDISATNLQSEAPIVSGTINAFGPDLPTLLEVAGQLQGSNSELARYGRELQQSPDQSFVVNTNFDADFSTGAIEIPALELRALGTTISGAVSAGNLNTDAPVFNGRLNASGPDLPLLLQVIGQISEGRDSTLNTYGRQLRSVSNKSFAIDAPFDVNMATGSIDLSNIDANFLGFTLTGNVQGNDFQSSTGSLDGQINISGRNLGQILTAFDQSDLAEVIESLEFEAGLSGSRNNMAISPMTLDLVLSGPDIPNSPVTLALNADSTVNLDTESLTARNVSLTGLGVNLDGTLTLNDYGSDMNYSGQVSLPAVDLRSLLQQLNQEVPLTMDNTVFQTLAVNSDFSGTTDSLNLSSLDLTLDDSRFTGELALAGITTSTTTPDTKFNLDVTAINLDRYLAPESENLESNDIGNTELPIDTLRTLNVDGNINVGQLTYSGLNLQNLSLAINAGEGLLALAPITAELYQGSYSGDIRLSVSNDIPVASVDTSLTAINLAPLLQDFMDASYVSGTGNISLSLTGRGTDTATIKRNLNGTGALGLQDGVLQGVDVGSVLEQVERMIREQRPGTIARGQETPFETFSANINVENGIVSTNDLLIESSGFDVSGSGTLVNLTNDSMAFNLIASVDETPAIDEQDYDIGGYNLPIACNGLVSSPTCLPDIQAIIAGAIRSAIQRGLTDLLQRAIGDEVEEQTQGETTEETPQEEETDPAKELFNRALENIFNR